MPARRHESRRSTDDNMNILITGAAGFIGMHTAQRLIADGHQVVGIDNLNDYYDVQLKRDRLARLAELPGFTFVQVDVADRDALMALFDAHAITRVVHLAAQAGVRYSITNPHAYGEANLVGFLNVLEACRQHRIEHLVFASSSSVYGGNRKMPFSEADSVDHPVSLYAATKKANELMAHAYSHLYAIPTTGLRFFTVYGPWGRPDMAYFSFTKAIVEGRSIQVFNNGDMLRDFTYIDDIVDGVVATLYRPATADAAFDPLLPHPGRAQKPYRVFNIGNQNPVALGDFIAAIESAVGKSAIKEMLPMQPGDVQATYADVSALAEWTGVQPKTSIQAGIDRFVAWYKAYYRVS